MKRRTGTVVSGIRMPFISRGDDLVDLVVSNVLEVSDVKETDVIAVTESIVAISQGNFAHIDSIAKDIESKFGKNEHIGVVFPIFSRNRFAQLLRGISKGAKKITVLLNYPQDEVGNPIMDLKKWNPYNYVPNKDEMQFTGKEFRKKYGEYVHEFTKLDYIDLYESLNDNISVILSRDPAEILKHTKNVIAADIHNREMTKSYLIESGASKVLTMAEILNTPDGERGYNEKYGILGSNMFGQNEVKLFPRDCDKFVQKVQDEFYKRTKVRPHVMVYADGAFRDPVCGIWELADPVVCPGNTKGLEGSPSEVKLKTIVAGEKDKEAALRRALDSKDRGTLSLGTTPRQYKDLLGSIADLVSGSGDKGTPVILIQGYFDNLLKE
ncbi:MAG: coenzyme F420-0:L-glutamate ligase [Methanomassiliicoccaceae archaeon]|nr:coenzyme F420-0:L-glutamate ligase [Methanomassiliicoccaceae archaeon]